MLALIGKVGSYLGNSKMQLSLPARSIKWVRIIIDECVLFAQCSVRHCHSIMSWCIQLCTLKKYSGVGAQHEGTDNSPVGQGRPQEGMLELRFER